MKECCKQAFREGKQKQIDDLTYSEGSMQDELRKIKQETAKQILEELMDEIEDAQQAYKEKVWSGEESLSSLWCTYKIKLDKLKQELEK